MHLISTWSMFVVCWQFIRGICIVYNTLILHQRVDYFGSNVKAVKMCMIVMSDSNKLSKLVMLSDKYNLIKSNKSKLWWLHKYIPTHQFSLVWFTSTKPYNLQVIILNMICLSVFIKFKGKRRRGTVLLYSWVVRPPCCLHQAVPVHVLRQRWHSGDGKY